MANSMQELIGQIVAERRRQVPKVESHIAQWRSIAQGLLQLQSLVEGLPSEVRSSGEISEPARQLFSEQTRRDIDTAIEALALVQSRFSRATLNLGVSGQARTGKSTLLQSISGLGDDQIPVGSGLPVTAVRSRIFNVPGPGRAILALHTYDSFAREVLGPLHVFLSLPVPPSTVELYAAYRYPELQELEPEKAAKHESATLLQRLRGMQASLPSYRDLLIGEQRTVSLDQLRPFVAYPSKAEEEASSSPPRRYLAVSDIRIETPFPRTRVAQLGVVDLPGLGEVNASADERHVRGLQDEVDAVILVKRPLEGLAFWKTEDAAAVQTLDQARGDAGTRRDFVFVLINNSPADNSHLVDSLRHSLKTAANEGVEGKHFVILEANAQSQDEVDRSVLTPVLKHLAQRLPHMDRQVLAAAEARGRGAAARSLESLHNLQAAVTAQSAVVGSVRADVSRRAAQLHRDLAVSLREITQQLSKESGPDSTDAGFVAAVEGAAERAIAWIDGGFDDASPEDWRDNALREMLVQAGPFKVAEDAFNIARVGIASYFAEIDEYLNDVKVPELLAAVAEAIECRTGSLLLEGDANASLRDLVEKLDDCPDPCSGLARAVRQLLGLRFEFRYQTYPRIREELDRLRLQTVDPSTGEARPQITVEATAEGARELQRFLRQRSIQAVYETQKAIVQDIGTPARVLYAAAELFEDAFIRGRSSATEIDNIAHAYRDELWPGVYEGIDTQNARVRSLMSACTALENELGALAGVTQEKDA